MRERERSIELYDVNGRVWCLNDPTSQVRFVRGGLPDLEAKLIPHKVAGRVQPGSGIPQSQQATMRVGFYPGPEDLATLKRRFRAGWAHDRECTLRVSGGYMWPLEAHLRLPDDGAIASPQVLSPRQIFEVMEVPVWWEDGVWWDKRYLSRFRHSVERKEKQLDSGETREFARYDLANYGCVPLRIGVKTFECPSFIWKSGMSIAAQRNAAGVYYHTFGRDYFQDFKENRIDPFVVWLDKKHGFPVTDRNGDEAPWLQRAWWLSGMTHTEEIMPGETMQLWVSEEHGIHVWTGVKTPWA